MVEEILCFLAFFSIRNRDYNCLKILTDNKNVIISFWFSYDAFMTFECYSGDNIAMTPDLSLDFFELTFSELHS